MTDLQQLKTDLLAFRLHYLATNLEEICQRAKQANTSHQEFLDHIVRLETVEKSRRSTERRLSEASLMAFKDCDKVFPGAACLTAMIDRLTHHCDILTIQGQSFRHKESAEHSPSKKTH